MTVDATPNVPRQPCGGVRGVQARGPAIQRSRLSTRTFISSIRRVRRARPIPVPRARAHRCPLCRLDIARSPSRSESWGRSRSKRARGSRTTSGCSRSPSATPIIVGVIGNLEPEKPEFPEYLERYRKNPLFRGIRCGNLWGRDITAQVESPAFINGLKRLAEADLVMDTANPRLSLLQAIVRVTDKVAESSSRPRSPAGADAVRDRRGSRGARTVLRELGARPQVYVKLSAIIHSGERAGVDRARDVPCRARQADGCLRRGSRHLRQRLAEQRRRCARRQGLRGREGVFRDRGRERSPRSTSGGTRSPRTSGSSNATHLQPSL